MIDITLVSMVYKSKLKFNAIKIPEPEEDGTPVNIQKAVIFTAISYSIMIMFTIAFDVYMSLIVR
jgi:hypothetical protein